MPTNKDFKRVVRARMTKTGESYTAARAQLLKKRQTTDAGGRATPCWLALWQSFFATIIIASWKSGKNSPKGN